MIATAVAITTSTSAQEPDAPPAQPDSEAGEEIERLERDLDCLCEELKKLKELLESEQYKKKE